MNKIKGFFIALILLVLTIIIGVKVVDKKIDGIPIVIMRNYSSDLKYASPDRLISCMDSGTIPVFGSSELNSDSDKPYYLFNMHKKNEFNLLKTGEGGYQSIVHAGIIGSIGDKIESKKAAFLISPQWFTKEGIDPAALVGKLSLSHIHGLLNNDKIKDETKHEFINRLLDLTSSIKSLNEDIKSLSDSYFKNKNTTIADYVKLWREKTSRKLKLAYAFSKIDISEVEVPKPEPIPFETRSREADQRATEASNNNELGIENQYYNQYIKNDLEKYKNSNQLIIDENSPEFEDLKLFFKIASELGIDVQAYSVPFHGPWMDYTGTLKESREAYYEKIRKLTSEAGVELVDLSAHEYNMHFLKDVMHMGEKGWVIIDEELTKFRNK